MSGDTDTSKLEVSGFPENLRRRFKAICALRGRSMSAVLIELAEQYTADHEQGGKDGSAR
jgi:hypothetical protein